MSAELAIIDPFDRSVAQLDALDHACRTLGFFRVPFSVIDDEVREQAWEDARSFFALSTDQKMRSAFPEPGYPYGYAPFAFETLSASLDDGTELHPDLKESLAVGPDSLNHPSRPAPVVLADDPNETWLRSPSMWPPQPATLRTSWSAYFQALSAVSAQLLSLMAETLDLPVNYFEPLIDKHTSAMRALHYPELGTIDLDDLNTNTFRASAHSDYGTLTILRTDGVPGLEVQREDGSWAAVTHEPDTFVVNLGDSIAQWTNDRWRSTMHRVSCVSPAARQSMAFFHMANWDARIECLPTCVDDGEAPRHEPVLAGPWLMSKFQRTVAQDSAAEVRSTDG